MRPKRRGTPLRSRGLRRRPIRSGQGGSAIGCRGAVIGDRRGPHARRQRGWVQAHRTAPLTLGRHHAPGLRPHPLSVERCRTRRSSSSAAVFLFTDRSMRSSSPASRLRALFCRWSCSTASAGSSSSESTSCSFSDSRSASPAAADHRAKRACASPSCDSWSSSSASATSSADLAGPASAPGRPAERRSFGEDRTVRAASTSRIDSPPCATSPVGEVRPGAGPGSPRHGSPALAAPLSSGRAVPCPPWPSPEALPAGRNCGVSPTTYSVIRLGVRRGSRLASLRQRATRPIRSRTTPTTPTPATAYTTVHSSELIAHLGSAGEAADQVARLKPPGSRESERAASRRTREVPEMKGANIRRRADAGLSWAGNPQRSRSRAV